MKRFLFTSLAFAALFVFTITVDADTPVYNVLDSVDINTESGAVTCTGTCSSFNPMQPGAWGGEFGHGAVTAFPVDGDNAGYVTLYTPYGAAKAIKIRHLDGIANDSFNVFVLDNHGDWACIGHYSDNGIGTETWVVTTFEIGWDIEGDRVNIGRGLSIEIQIMPTDVGWSGFNTWGQLAIDWVDLLGRGEPE